MLVGFVITYIAVGKYRRFVGVCLWGHCIMSVACTILVVKFNRGFMLSQLKSTRAKLITLLTTVKTAS